MNGYIGNPSYSAAGDEIAQASPPLRRSRGFGFVEMPNDGEAHPAISTLSRSDLDGRSIMGNEVKPRTGCAPHQ